MVLWNVISNTGSGRGLPGKRKSLQSRQRRKPSVVPSFVVPSIDPGLLPVYPAMSSYQWNWILSISMTKEHSSESHKDESISQKSSITIVGFSFRAKDRLWSMVITPFLLKHWGVACISDTHARPESAGNVHTLLTCCMMASGSLSPV